MSSTKEQILTFLEKCDELKKCKFIMATTKIKDLLKCIVNSPELYKLFDTVTKNFNYIEQRSKCLVTANDGFLNRSYVVLPQTVGYRLAFIFCLLVEFDRDSLNFNEFLQKYFPEDGSYFASYQAFCKVIISSLEDLIKQVFKEQLSKPDPEVGIAPAVKANPARSNLISTISIAIEAEKEYISQIAIARDEKENGYKILTALSDAVRCGDEELIDALISGYNYFILYHRCVSDGIAPLIESLAEFEQTL